MLAIMSLVYNIQVRIGIEISLPKVLGRFSSQRSAQALKRPGQNSCGSLWHDTIDL